MRNGFNCTLVAREPTLLLYIGLPKENPSLLLPGGFDGRLLLASIEREFELERGTLSASAFRSVPLERLAAVVQNGIDVDPPRAPIFTGPFEKAWEYGYFPKLVMALDPKLLGATWTIPGRVESERRRPYEAAYQRWIPGNPMEALKAVLLFGRESDRVLEQVAEIVGMHKPPPRYEKLVMA